MAAADEIFTAVKAYRDAFSVTDKTYPLQYLAITRDPRMPAENKTSVNLEMAVGRGE